MRQGSGMASVAMPGKDQCMKFNYQSGNEYNQWPNATLKKHSEDYLAQVLALSQQILKWMIVMDSNLED